MNNSPDKIDLTIFFPVYNDERTVRHVTEKAIGVCQELAQNYEVLIIDDCSPDNSGKIADQLASEHSCVRVVHHEKNLGYGAAVKTGFKNSTYEWICFTDGDDEYDIEDLKKMVKLKDFYDLVITFRYRKLYSGKRIFISNIYNKVLRMMFRTPYRDISTGLRFIRKSLLGELNLTSDSPFIGAELTIKTMLKGYRIGELGIQTFPREFGKGSATSLKNIMATIRDMRKIHREIFSDDYELPTHRGRK
ncbi:MAG TPA: glycosyltransferase family 2 protein [Bacteroidia bacterium]|nr:glycosyltransferase family 2 protein [Bacteroidia bacterium]